MNIRCVTLVIIVSLGQPEARGSENFIDQRYRGWLWFEEKYADYNHSNNIDHITPEEATREIELLKENLDNKRSVMIARPTPENVRDYIIIEEIMWRKALALDNAYREAKFKYPEYFDKLNNPTNVHAVKFQRKLIQKNLENKIRNFVQEFDLILFSKSGCPYCIEFAPVLKRFSDIYGFKTEEVSMGGDGTGLFRGEIMPDLAIKLGIKVFPTIVAVSKNSKHAFEMIRGYVTISELEEYAVLAADYADRLKNEISDVND